MARPRGGRNNIRETGSFEVERSLISEYGDIRRRTEVV